MFRRDKWWIRELERRERAWDAERAQLVATVCHLAGRPLPPLFVDDAPVDDVDDYEADLVSPEYLTLP